MDHTKLACPECGAENSVTEKCVEIEFEYGRGSDAVKLKAWVPHLTCSACEFGFLDHRGSTVKDAVAQAHLLKQVRAENKVMRPVVDAVVNLLATTKTDWMDQFDVAQAIDVLEDAVKAYLATQEETKESRNGD